MTIAASANIGYLKVLQHAAKTRWVVFGFKLHLAITEQGDLVAFNLTPGNVDDRPSLQGWQHDLFGKVFGDKGYLSQTLAAELRKQGIDLVTSIRRNMKPQLIPLVDKLLLKKRAVIGSVNNILKNILHVDHSRHHSIDNFFVNLIAGLVAYCHRPNKPSIQLPDEELSRLALSS